MPVYSIPPTGSTRSLTSNWGVWGEDTLRNDTNPDTYPTFRWSTVRNSLAFPSGLQGSANIWPLSSSWGSMGDSRWSNNGPFYKIDLASDNSTGYRGLVGITSPFGMTIINAHWVRLPWFMGAIQSTFTVQAYPFYGNTFQNWRINTAGGTVWSSSNPLTISRTDSLITNNANLRLVATFSGSAEVRPVDAIAISGADDKCGSEYFWFGLSLAYAPVGQNWSNANTFYTDSARTQLYNGNNRWFTSVEADTGLNTGFQVDSRVQISATGSVLERSSRLTCPQ